MQKNIAKIPGKQRNVKRIKGQMCKYKKIQVIYPAYWLDAGYREPVFCICPFVVLCSIILIFFRVKLENYFVYTRQGIFIFNISKQTKRRLCFREECTFTQLCLVDFLQNHRQTKHCTGHDRHCHRIQPIFGIKLNQRCDRSNHQ